MSTNSSDWLSLKGNRSPVASQAESLLLSISEITSAVAGIKTEHDNFIEIGCYFYRVSSVIIQFQSAPSTPGNTMEMLRPLSRSIDMAKDLVGRCNNGEPVIPDPEIRSIVELLGGVIKQLGEDLSLIVPPAETGDQEYTHIAVQSLIQEMKTARFGVNLTQASKQREEPKEPLALLKKGSAHKEPQGILKKASAHGEPQDLYSIDVEDAQRHKSASKRVELELERRSSRSSTNLSEMSQYMEPSYETFFCPLTRKIMDDPVTIESGVTYEREAITDWYQKFENQEEIVCPQTGQKIFSRVLSTNMALKATIEQWEERNEAARIKVAQSALTLASTKPMVLEALVDLQNLCRKRQYNKGQVRNNGILPLLGTHLKNKDRNVRFETLELLRDLAEDDNEAKETIAKAVDVSLIMKMLSSNFQPNKHAALLLLLELSKSHSACDRIGLVMGGILVLITMKYRRASDAFASEKADDVLRNLEVSVINIKSMAVNGHWEPLLNRLTEGDEEMKMKMASYLSEIVVRHDLRSYVAERASPALIQMVQVGNTLTRNVAFKALKQIALHHPNCEILVKAGILSIMFEEMFTRTIYEEPMTSKKEAAAILANILESGIELDTLQVNTQGHTMSSEYIIYNIINRLRNSTPEELKINLIKILLCLMKFPKSSATIVSVVKEAEASYNLIDLINNLNNELVVISIKFLIALSSFMGHTLAERLCKTQGQLEALLQEPAEMMRITEKHAVSANFIAKLPHQNLLLNLALLGNNTVPKILQKIDQIQQSGTRTSRYGSAYLEGLVGILVRFTTTLYEYQILVIARTYNFTAVFTELLMNTSSDEVQKLSAIGLENLSSNSINLSKLPEIKKRRSKETFFLPKCLSCNSSMEEKISLCPVHRGNCSSEETFCLVDAKAIGRLLACLDHGNVQVVEAALSALCTLLDDKVDLDESVSMLIEVNAIQHVLNVVKEHKEERLWQKSFWMLEKFLMKGGDYSASEISQDRLLPATLIGVLHHGDGSIRQMAERILRKMASFSMEDFVGDGALKELLPKLLDEGWDDVPTLKIMNSDDMSAINMTQEHKDALEIRSYLHDRALMQYADKLEASGKCLPELLNLSTADLSSQFGMKRGHLARFMDRTSSCAADPMPPSFSLPSRKKTTAPSRNTSMYKSESASVTPKKLQAMPTRSSIAYDSAIEQSMADFKIKDGYIFKGIVASVPDEPRACGCVQPPPIVENVAPYPIIEGISVQKLTPEYKIGMERLVTTKTPPMKASVLWQDGPALLLCIRRPGCIMCRAEAHKLYSKKPIFDALGVKLYAILHENIESEVKDFWPRYWGGVVLLDKSMEFFKALGGGKLLKDKFISGFLFNPRARANYKRAKAMGVEQNFRGEGEIKGGLFLIGKGKSGIAYQFIERNFGDWAPIAEVLDICTKLQNPQESQVESIRSF